jgi:hypothetical protein
MCGAQTTRQRRGASAVWSLLRLRTLTTASTPASRAHAAELSASTSHARFSTTESAQIRPWSGGRAVRSGALLEQSVGDERAMHPRTQRCGSASHGAVPRTSEPCMVLASAKRRGETNHAKTIVHDLLASNAEKGAFCRTCGVG